MDLAFRGLVGGAGVVETTAYLRLVTGEPHPFGNFAFVSAPSGVDAVREAVDGLMSRPDVPSAVILGGDPVSAEVETLLTGLGFAAHPPMPAMGVDIDRLPHTSLPDDYHFDAVSAEDAEEWTLRFAEGYEVPVGVARCFSLEAAARHDAAEGYRFYAVRHRGAIVCTSASYLADGVAGIYCVSTVPAERRKGLAAHATAEPLRIAAGDGYRVGVLQSSEAGHGVYLGLGFGDFGGVPLYVRFPD
jgi:hypothetical protein